jgi:hypothetical protein
MKVLLKEPPKTPLSDKPKPLFGAEVEVGITPLQLGGGDAVVDPVVEAASRRVPDDYTSGQLRPLSAPPPPPRLAGGLLRPSTRPLLNLLLLLLLGTFCASVFAFSL